MQEVTAKASKELAAAIIREQLLPIHSSFVLRREQVNINFLNSFLLRLYGNYLLKEPFFNQISSTLETSHFKNATEKRKQ